MKKSRFLSASRRSIQPTRSSHHDIIRGVAQTLAIAATLLRFTSVALNPELEVESNRKNVGRTPCGIYIAESSIPGSGIGLYAGVSYSKGSVIGSPDVAIPVIDREFHHDDNPKVGKRPLDWILSDYFWEANACAPANLETFDDGVDCVVPSLGMAANSHQGLYNAEFDVPRVGSGGLNRFHHPSAGSSTQYRVEFTATSDLKAGTEVFMDYGESWFTVRDKVLGYTPLGDDYLWADTALKKMLSSNVFSSEIESIETEKRYALLKNLVSSIDIRKGNALPKLSAELKRAEEKGAAAYSAPDYIRSIEWLEENGTCIDSVQEKQSTIPGAGWGAFLKRSVKKGEVVIVSPLIHFPYDEVMDMYDHASAEVNDSTADFYAGEEKYSTRKKGEKIIGKQLLTNYVFGHPDSSMLFFPYAGSMGLINHGGEGKANVKLQWPSGKGPALKYHQQSWFDLTVDQLAAEDKQKRGLMIEIIATRDIDVDEEVFLDYGPAWQEAWDDHVKKWKPWKSNGNYESSSSLRVNGYPGANITASCHFDFEDIDELEEFDADNDDDIQKRIFNWYLPTSENAEVVLGSEYILPCTINDRKIINGEEYFTAIVSAAPHHDPDDEDNTPLFRDVILSNVKVEVRKIPRKAIVFYEKEQIRTENELVDHPYAGANIATACYFDFDDIEELEEFVSDDEDEDNIPKKIFNWYLPTSENAKIVLSAAYILPCTIIGRDRINDQEYFTAIVSARPNHDAENEDNAPLLTDVILSKVIVEVRKIPRHGITFIDKPYSGDSHLPGTFRFPMMVPDEVFPKKWKNLLE